MTHQSPSHRFVSRTAYFLLITLFFFTTALTANNIQVANIELKDHNTSTKFMTVQFDLSWENSWRTDNLFPDDGHDVGNWDAAWVFVKYRLDGGEWRHAKLHNAGHNAGTGTAATLEIGVPDERSAYDAENNPGVGAFVYRSENGSGTFTATGIQLRWNYGVDEIELTENIEIRVFAIEMVYVAPGPFYVGSGGSEEGRFIAGGTSNNPFLVTADWNKSIENTNGGLWATGLNGSTGNLVANYPTGVEGFYSMKYEVSQQQYVDFLNTLTPTQASARAYTSGGFRNGIQVSGGVYSTTNPYVANNYMSWMDGAAYVDWAGLRPMTELEFEKAARGPATPVANEYVWGSSSITQATGLSNAGTATESASNSGANAVYGNHSSVQGPARVGMFAGDGSNREQSGASYWGVMELSGNLWERSVTVGNTDGRVFTGRHGDGVLTVGGLGNVAFWPGGGAGGVSGATGSGFRGGGWDSGSTWLRSSDRTIASNTFTNRILQYGFRGVRGLPVAVGGGL